MKRLDANVPQARAKFTPYSSGEGKARAYFADIAVFVGWISTAHPPLRRKHWRMRCAYPPYAL